MKRFVIAMVPVLAIAALISGCEWSSSGGGQTWNDSWSWVDFSGTYRAEDGGVLVSGFTGTPGTEPDEINITGEVIGTIAPPGPDWTFNYSGTLDNKPVKEGSLVINAGVYTWTDNGDGTLTGTSETVGTINYETGAWTISLVDDIIPGEPTIVASYLYTSGGTEGQEDPGNTGNKIYSFVVTQSGNILRFVDNNGAVYDGNFFSVEPGGGDDTGQTSGIVTGQFEVQGNSSSGARVTITGSFTGTYNAGAAVIDPADDSVVVETFSDMSGKAMNGTWIESSISGDIKAISGT
ncbi:MAG: hypothetical protein ISS35_09985 [Kiritimatiellae bacterium]|nr:hypothetical protein [Kiritimatiellia bacterium]